MTFPNVLITIAAYELGRWLYHTGKRAWKLWRSTRGPLRTKRIGFAFADEVDDVRFSSGEFEDALRAYGKELREKRAGEPPAHEKGQMPEFPPTEYHRGGDR